MNAREYLKGVLPEALILLAAATSLGYLFSTAFYATDGVDAAVPLALGACALLLAALYACAYSKRTALVGGVVLAVVLLAAFAITLVAGGGANVLQDYEGNTVLFMAVVVLTCIGCFLLSRRRVLCVLLVAGGIFAYGVIQYLYLEGHVVAFFVFVASGAALVMYRTYRLGLVGSVTRRTAFVPVFVFTALVALVAVGLSAGVYYLIVQPLDPAAQEIKLITEYRALEELPRRGVSEELSITNPNMTSTVINGEYSDADQDQDEDRETETDPQGNSVSEAMSSAVESIGSSVGYAADSAQSLFDLITFNQAWYGYLLLILLVAAILAAPVLLKRYLRKRFYQKARALPPAECVETLYLRFMRNFGRMGIQRGKHATPYEFAYQAQRDLAAFAENEEGASFMRVTLAFVRASFGEKEPTQQDLRACCSFYESFYKNSRTYLGTPKYLRLYFRL